MKKIDLLLLFLIGIIVFLILFFSRQIFFYHYEPEYYENYYYNSQWNVPQSTRGISDGELYKFVGFRLVEGENPFNLNYEVPPFAKYLYGLAEKTVGNPYWISLGFYFLSAYGIFLLSWELFKNQTTSLIGVLLFVTTPFVGTQVRETMLDLPLTALFLGNALFFTRFFKRLKSTDLILAGIFLGLATGTKIGIYTPLALILGLVLVILSSRKLINGLIYFISVGSGYVLSFFCYFIRHPNPIPWIRLHEKPLSFYLQTTAGGTIDYLNQWRGIFANTYKGFWAGAGGEGLGDWSLVLPLGVISGLFILFISFKKRDYSWLYLVLLSWVFLTINTLIPFWPRYLMPAVPLFILFVLFVFKKFVPFILLLVFLNLIILFPTLTVRNLPGHTSAVARFLNTRAYRELYRSLDSETRNLYPEAQFQSAMENFYLDLGVKKVETTIFNTVDSGPTHQALIRTQYQSNFGLLENNQVMRFVLEHNQWKTVWQWDYLWPGYLPGTRILVQPASSRSIFKNQKSVYVIPRLMYDWGKYSSALANLTKMGMSLVDTKLRETIPDDFPRFVGLLDPGLDPDTLKNNLLPGITIKDEISIYPVTITIK